MNVKEHGSFWILLICSVLVINQGLFVHGKDAGEKRRLEGAVREFTQHDVVRPLLYHGGQHRPSTATLNGHIGEASLSLTAFNHTFVIDLSLNRDIFPQSNFIIKYFTPEGSSVIYKPENHTQNHCYYHGKIQTILHSVVAVSTCSGISGLISSDSETYYIEPIDNHIGGKHFVFRESDRIANTHKCGFNDDVDSVPIYKPKKPQKWKRRKRSIRWPYDTTEKTRIVELYIANDFHQYDNYNRDISKVIARTKDIVNIVNSLYRPIDIYVALVGIEIWTSGDQIEVVGNADRTMNNFLEYRREKISPQHKNDNAQLITGHMFSDGVVGKAVKSTICSWQYSGGVDMDHSKVVGPVATTVAHEMGHNFGMQHDDHTCSCPDDRCIMAASSGGKNPTKWSSCSSDNLADAFHQGLDYCLLDLPEDLYGSPMCGNGFVEDGEECDCGLTEDCSTPCCNATTCKLMQNATCATGKCCDVNTCQMKEASTPCRKSQGECDLAEYCDGRNEYCPADVYLQNGLPCQDNTGYCFNGKCPSHDGQCSKLWGPTGQSSHPLCYEHFNTFGEANGNCGFNWLDKSFQKCEKEDVMCGMLHCTHRNERLVFWKEALSYLMPEAWVTVNGTRQDCKGAILDAGLNMPDPGMTPEGTKCAQEKVCINAKCRGLDTLEIPACPHCNGLGVCNSLGQCHCQVGYAPPYCDKAGPGGSHHSGPIKVLQANSILVIAMVLLFLLVLPLLGAVSFLSYRYRQKLKKLWNGRPYKYDTSNGFLHRAKRSEPPRAPVAVTRPDPKTTQDHSKRQSFRDQPISSPKLESTTKTAQSLENMTDVGYRARALPLRPDQGPTSPTSPPHSAAISPPPVPNGVPSYRTPHLPSYPQPHLSTPNFSSSSSAYHSHQNHLGHVAQPTSSGRYYQNHPSAAGPSDSTHHHLPPERPPPTYMDKVAPKQNNTPEDTHVDFTKPPTPPPPLLKPRMRESGMEQSTAPQSMYKSEVSDSGFYDYESSGHKYENVPNDNAASHIDSLESNSRGANYYPTSSSRQSPIDRSHSPSQGPDSSNKPSNRMNDLKNKFDQGANNTRTAKPFANSKFSASRNQGVNPDRSQNDMSRSNPVRRSHTTAGSKTSSGDRPRNSAGRSHTSAGRKPAINRAGKPQVGKKPDISAPKPKLPGVNAYKFKSRPNDDQETGNSEC